MRTLFWPSLGQKNTLTSPTEPSGTEDRPQGAGPIADVRRGTRFRLAHVFAAGPPSHDGRLHFPIGKVLKSVPF